MHTQTIRIPLLSDQTFCGTGVPGDWQNWKIKQFRDVRQIVGARPCDRYIGVPVTGDSMRNEGIVHGDILVTRLTHQYTDENKIGVWQTPHGRTAKFAYQGFDGSIVLHNKNGWSQEWQISEVELVGIVVRVERDYE